MSRALPIEDFVQAFPGPPGETWAGVQRRHREYRRGRLVEGVGVRFKTRQVLKLNEPEYREDLARFPGDPEAFVTGPDTLRRLVDKRKRAGWDFDRPAWDEVERELTYEERAFETLEDLPSVESMVREAYAEGHAEGWRLDPTQEDTDEEKRLLEKGREHGD